MKYENSKDRIEKAVALVTKKRWHWIEIQWILETDYEEYVEKLHNYYGEHEIPFTNDEFSILSDTLCGYYSMGEVDNKDGLYYSGLMSEISVFCDEEGQFYLLGRV